jgi:glucokinase
MSPGHRIATNLRAPIDNVVIRNQTRRPSKGRNRFAGDPKRRRRTTDVVQLASQTNAQTRARRANALLAADVGGTYARIGLVSADNGRVVRVSHYEKYVCADYPSLSAIFARFLSKHGDAAVADVAIACAGYPIGDTVINASLPWKVSLADIRRDLGVRDIALVNDFTAVAHAIGQVNPAQAILMTAGVPDPIAGPTLVVGPGTGLGASVQIPCSQRPIILSTEAGQAALAPRTELEIEILKILGRGSRHVANEEVLSGPGLVGLYAALCTLRGIAPMLQAPAEISDAALKSDDRVALESLQVFCAWLGSVVGDLVLLYGAQGGVYLAGGILPQIQQFLLHSNFVGRFVDKGAMREPLERVPIRLIEHGQLGVIGAANWYLDAQRAE